MKQKFNYFLLIWIFISSLSLSAQRKMTLYDCMIWTYENNLSLKNQQIKEKNYEQNIRKAKDDRLPSVSANFNGNAMWGRGIDPFTNTYVNQQFNTYNGGINGNLILFQGDYYVNNVKLQKQILDRNASEVQRIKNDLLIELTLKYTSILYLQEMVKNYQGIIANSQSNIDMVSKRIEAGNIAQKELFKVKSQKETEQYNLITAQNNLNQNWIELKLLMNMDPNEPVELIPDDNIAITDSLNIDRDKFISDALDFAPELKIQTNQFEQSKLNLKLAKSGFYPTISLGGSLSSAYSDLNRFLNFSEQFKNNRSSGLQLNANIPIFSQMKTRNSVKSANIDIESKQLAIDIERQRILKIYYKAYNDFLASKQKMSLTQSTQLNQQINYDTERLRYTSGMGNLQELNLAKTNLTSAISNATQAKYELIYNYFTLKIYRGLSLWKE